MYKTHSFVWCWILGKIVRLIHETVWYSVLPPRDVKSSTILHFFRKALPPPPLETKSKCSVVQKLATTSFKSDSDKVSPEKVLFSQRFCFSRPGFLQRIFLPVLTAFFPNLLCCIWEKNWCLYWLTFVTKKIGTLATPLFKCRKVWGITRITDGILRLLSFWEQNLG